MLGARMVLKSFADTLGTHGHPDSFVFWFLFKLRYLKFDSSPHWPASQLSPWHRNEVLGQPCTFMMEAGADSHGFHTEPCHFVQRTGLPKWRFSGPRNEHRYAEWWWICSLAFFLALDVAALFKIFQHLQLHWKPFLQSVSGDTALPALLR